MKSSIKQYIHDTLKKDAKISYDPSVKQWIGVLHHESGDIYSQQKTKTAVIREMAEILEEFLVRFLEKKDEHKIPSTRHVKAHSSQVPRSYLQA